MTTGLRLIPLAAGGEPQEQVLDDDLFPVPNVLANTMDATLSIQAIRDVEKLVAQYDLQDAQSQTFYADKKRRCEERIDHLKRSISAFLDQNGLKNLQTPAGTAFRKTFTIKHWPDDEALLEWVGLNLPEAIRIKREPEKKLIADHIKLTGEVPLGYEETSETRLYIR
jgi:hypothetical protein